MWSTWWKHEMHCIALQRSRLVLEFGTMFGSFKKKISGKSKWISLVHITVAMKLSSFRFRKDNSNKFSLPGFSFFLFRFLYLALFCCVHCPLGEYNHSIIDRYTDTCTEVAVNQCLAWHVLSFHTDTMSFDLVLSRVIGMQMMDEKFDVRRSVVKRGYTYRLVLVDGDKPLQYSSYQSALQHNFIHCVRCFYLSHINVPRYLSLSNTYSLHWREPTAGFDYEGFFEAQRVLNGVHDFSLFRCIPKKIEDSSFQRVIRSTSVSVERGKFRESYSPPVCQ